MTHSPHLSSMSNDPIENLDSTGFQLNDINLEETFELIQSLIPLKTCQYYQLLPIKLAENCLTLAMVNIHDILGLDHIKILITPFNYSLKIKQIDQQTHQIIISSYLNYSRAIISEQKMLEDEQEEHETKIEVDDSELEQLPPEIRNKFQKSSSDLTASDLENTAILIDKNIDKNEDISQIQLNQTSSSLKVEARYLSAPADFLATLAPAQIWRELLGRVLLGGIGRLYFEQKANYGRILWSQNGALQFAVNEISIDVFREVLTEIKRVAHLPPVTVHKITKVEIEKYYQGERLLFRLRLHPGEHGEEGNLQILRGKALIFYQQRQMNDMATQALQMAQQLERKLRQIRARKKINPSPITNIAELLELQESIQRQLKLLQES